MNLTKEPLVQCETEDREITISDLLIRRSLDSGPETAFEREVENGWITTTWSEYASSVDRLAIALFNCGLRRGDAVGIAIPTNAEWELLHFAALRIGAIVVGIEPNAGESHLLKIVSETNCRALIVEEITGTVAKVLSAAAGCQVLVTTVSSGNCPDLSCAVFTLDALLRSVELEQVAERLVHLPFPSSSDPATVVYTSGTTGEPKGIVYTHAQILLAVKAIVDALSFTAMDVTICWLPLSSLFQRMVNLASVSQGAKIVFIKEPLKLMKYLKIVKPTIVFGVPRFFEKVTKQIEARLREQAFFKEALFRLALSLGQHRGFLLRFPMLREAFAGLDALCFRDIRNTFGGAVRLMVSGSAPLDTTIVGFFNAVGLNLLEAYALSENIIPMAMNKIDDRRAGSVGKTLSDNQVRIAADGEVQVRGPGVFAGYLGSDSQSAFTPDGFYKTGDLGYFDRDGFLFLSGRKSEVVKSSTGKKLSLCHIEQYYQKCSLVDRVVAIGAGRKCVVALVTLAGDSGPIADKERMNELRKRVGEEFTSLSTQLEAHQRVRGYAILPSPFTCESGELTASQKLRRSAISKKYEAVVEEIYQVLDESLAVKRSKGEGANETKVNNGSKPQVSCPKSEHGYYIDILGE